MARSGRPHPAHDELAAIDDVHVERLRRSAAEEHELAARLEQRQHVGQRAGRRKQCARESLALRGGLEAELGCAPSAPRLGLQHPHAGAARAQGLRGEQADRARPGHHGGVAGEPFDAAQHAGQGLDERAGQVAHVIGQRQHGVGDVLARGRRQLAEPAGLERAGGEGGTERLVARQAVSASAARDMVGERDAEAGGQCSVDDDARDLVAEHGAGRGAARPQLLDVAAAETTGPHAHEDAAGWRGGGGELAQCGRPSGRDRHGEHERSRV